MLLTKQLAAFGFPPIPMLKNSTALTRIALALLVAIVVIRPLTLGFFPLYDTTEARYAEIARKMLELNDWVTPWFDYGVPFWGKPPLSFWLSAFSMKLFGINEFAARLPHYLCAFLLGWLVWDWAARNSRREAFYAVALLAGSALFFSSAGAVMTDMELALSCFLVMRGFWLGLHGIPEERKRERWLLFIGLGLGLLAKGPIAAVLSGLPIAVWTLFKSNIATVWRGLPWLRGILLTLLIAVPWYLIAEQHTPGFLNYFLVGEHWHRFVTPGWSGDLYGHAHLYPHGTIWIFTFAALLPWVLILPIAAWRWRKSEPHKANDHSMLQSWRVYLLLWGIAPCIFFTEAANIIWTYDLPGLPALALWAASWLSNNPSPQRAEKLIIAGLIFTLLGWTGFLVKLELRGKDDVKVAKALTLDYMARRKNDEALTFYHNRPFSAQFYSRGKAQLVNDLPTLSQKMDQKRTYIALRPFQIQHLPTNLMQRLRLLERHGDFNLYVSDPARNTVNASSLMHK